MSMLAERRQKQKWSLNPRGKHWSEDVNKFGQKMLEKMGWSVGKGLGANEDGVTEHIKVSYKYDAKGMGFKDNGEAWTKHEANFTSLLENLGSSEKNLQKPATSLEQKSRNSRARVHYHKFTRGKDLSLKSEKDLAQIFGRKTLEKVVIPDEIRVEEEEDKKFGVTTISGGNMAEYFKNKLQKIEKNTNETNFDSEDDVGRPGFGFGAGTVTPEVVAPEERKRKRIEEPEVKKPKKKLKKTLAFDNPAMDLNLSEEICYDNPTFTPTIEPSIISEPSGIDNPGFDPEKKSKKVTFASPEAVHHEIIDFDSKFKKKSKKKSKMTGIDNSACEELTKDDESVQQIEEKPRKKKKKSKVTAGIDNLACEEQNDEPAVVQPQPEEPPKKKKKKSKKTPEIPENCPERPTNGIVNLGCEINRVEETVANINQELDNYQNQLENKLNEKKFNRFRAAQQRPNKSCKHLISSGTLRVQFSGANLHQIAGYGAEI